MLWQTLTPPASPRRLGFRAVGMAPATNFFSPVSCIVADMLAVPLALQQVVGQSGRLVLLFVILLFISIIL